MRKDKTKSPRIIVKNNRDENGQKPINSNFMQVVAQTPIQQTNPVDFCYFLQGFAEVVQDKPTSAQWEIIKDKLETVFNKVTPQYRNPSDSQTLPANQTLPFQYFPNNYQVNPYAIYAENNTRKLIINENYI